MFLKVHNDMNTNTNTNMHLHMHAVSLALLARPALKNAELAFLEGITPVADLLWQGGSAAERQHSADASTPDTAAFLDALHLLVPDAVEAGAVAVAQTLRLVQKSWRELPGAAIRVMAQRLVEAAPGTPDATLAALEIQSVAAWWIATEQPAKRANRQWSALVASARRWREVDEIVLRQAPEVWSFPLQADMSVAGFDMQPITSTDQLVESAHHKGVLCLLARRDACKAGLEAWVFARPRLLESDAGLCLFGMTRPDIDAPWGEPQVYAPAELLEVLTCAADSVAARDQVARGLAHVRQVTNSLRPSALQAMAMLQALLKRSAS